MCKSPGYLFIFIFINDIYILVTLTFVIFTPNFLFQLFVSSFTEFEVSTAFRFPVNCRHRTDKLTDGRTERVQRFVLSLREGCIIKLINDVTSCH